MDTKRKKRVLDLIGMIGFVVFLLGMSSTFVNVVGDFFSEGLKPWKEYLRIGLPALVVFCASIVLIGTFYPDDHDET